MAHQADKCRAQDLGLYRLVPRTLEKLLLLNDLKD